MWRLPEILVITFKRFSSTSHSAFAALFGGYGEKIQDLIDFPIRGLDLSNYVDSHSGNLPLYDLFAVVVIFYMSLLFFCVFGCVWVFWAVWVWDCECMSILFHVFFLDYVRNGKE